MEERLQKTIARSGLASRRQAEQMIAEGRVSVGGEIVTQAGLKVDPAKDDIRVDGVRVRPDRPRRYVLLNKPVGYLTTRSDPRRRRTVMQLLPISLRALFPVGRLDMATSGLLLLTDDGDFAQRVAHPRYGITKTYADYQDVRGHGLG
jgi:23S rRNA pseudouridine2605 synthase